MELSTESTRFFFSLAHGCKKKKEEVAVSCVYRQVELMRINAQFDTSHCVLLALFHVCVFVCLCVKHTAKRI